MALQTPANGFYTRIFNLFVEVLAHTSIYTHYPIPIVKRFYGSRWVCGKDEEIFNYDSAEINGFTVIVNTTTTGLWESIISYGGGNMIFCNIPDGCTVTSLGDILRKLISAIAPNENSVIASAFGDVGAYLIAKLVNSIEKDITITGKSPIDESECVQSRSLGCTITLGHIFKDKAEYLRNLKDSDITAGGFSSLISKLFDNYEFFTWLSYANGEPLQASLSL